MFCNQCEQTAGGTGCTRFGVCGKSPEVAGLQDLLLYALKGLSVVADDGRKQGVNEQLVNRFINEAAFSTLTNVNFDSERFITLIKKTVELRESLKDKISNAGASSKYDNPAVNYSPADSLEGLLKQAENVGIKSNEDIDPDVHSLQQLLIFGIKGVAAYADHAYLLGQEDDKIYAFIQEGLAATLDPKKTVPEMYDLVMKCGEVNLRAMELLDAGNTGKYGHPVPTEVPLGHMKGKAILVSGHDLKDLDKILKQSEGKGIYVYTHGEMLPTHGYPELKKYSHFYGHYGTAWQNQQREFNEWFFSTVQIVFAGNDSEGMKYGTIGTEEKYFLRWKEDEVDDSSFKLDKYLLKMCRKDRLIELMHDFVLFDGGIWKMPRVHQYFGVKAAQAYARQNKGGIIWHTQGSG